MTEQYGAGGPLGHPASDGTGGAAAPGPLSPAPEEPARPSGPPATGGSAPSAHGAPPAPATPAAPAGQGQAQATAADGSAPSSGPWAGWQDRGSQASTTAGQPGPAPTTGGLQTAGTSAPEPGAGRGGAPGGSTQHGNPWGDYPGVDQGGPRRHPTEMFPAPSGVPTQPGRSVQANRAPSQQAPTSYGSAPAAQGSAPTSYGSAPAPQASASASYGSAPAPQSSASASYGSASASYGSAAGTGPAPSGHQAPPAPGQFPATQPSQQPAQTQPAQTQPANPNGPGGSKPGSGSRRHFLATAGIAGVVSLIVGGGAGAAGAAIAGSLGDDTEPTPPPGGENPGGGEEPGEAVGAKVAAKVLPSTVTILVSASSGNSSGSGFVLDTDGLIMTNNHVVDSAVDSGRITVLFEDGNRATAEVVGRSPSYDIGVIRVDPGGLELVPAEIGDSDKVKVGDLAIALGAPLGLGGSVTEGIISARNRPVAVGSSAEDASFMNALQTDAPINPGNSGGPLADGTGKIIGVNSAILSNATGDQRPGSIGIGFAIPISQAKVIGEQIVETGHATYPTIGVKVGDAGNRQGARIAEIEPGSPAADSGLQEDDVVIKINDRPVATMVEFIVALRSHRPGDEVTITYNRSGTPEETKVTLGEEQG